MSQLVIEANAYANEVNSLITDNSILYPYSAIMGQFNVTDPNFKFSGERAIIITGIDSGDDSPADLQNYTLTTAQQWKNTQKVLTISQSREYSDFVDFEYAKTNKLNSTLDVMQSYEQNKRPKNLTRYFSHALTAISVADKSAIYAGTITTSADAYAKFKALNMNRRKKFLSSTHFYCTSAFESLLEDYVNTNRRYIDNNKNPDGSLLSLDGVQIVVVTDEDIKNKYNLATKGYADVDGSVQVYGLMVVDRTIINPLLMNDILIDEPTAFSKGKSYIYTRSSYDVFEHPQAEGFGVQALISGTAPV